MFKKYLTEEKPSLMLVNWRNICALPVEKFEIGEAEEESNDFRKVYIAGSFLQNGAMVRMTQVYDGFLTCFELPPGHFDFKFFVDGQWRLSDQYSQHLIGAAGEDLANATSKLRNQLW
uniref:5'-AMP-activated protein kinase subunit beta-1 n=1 Tax=Romanomermis culicivorax TaxID=13658 RepID=A0A915L0J4_ROMCU